MESRGGNGGGGGGGLSARWAQMARQRQLIEQRRLLLQQRQAASETATTNPSPLNAFSNDGSFLDKFKKLAETKTIKKQPPKHEFAQKSTSDPTRKDTNNKSDFDTGNTGRDYDSSNRRHNKDRSRSRSRDRKHDKRDNSDKRNRQSHRWESGNRRKRSYSPCTPVVEDMPHLKPSRFTNILPSQIAASELSNPSSNYLHPKPFNINIANGPNFMNRSQNQIQHMRPGPQPKATIPTLLPRHLGSEFSERMAIPPPMVVHNIPNNNGMLQNVPLPPPPMMNMNDIIFSNVPLHTIPPPKPLDTISIPPPEPLDAITIPPPKPLDAISIPPPKPMNLQAIPPPSPICLTQIPKPKELDLCSIPHPPPTNVLLADRRLSPTMEAAAKQVALNGDSWELTLKTDSARADSMWFLHNTNSAEYKLYRSLVVKYREESNNSENKASSPSANDKYEPEFSLQYDSSDDDTSSRDDESEKNESDKKKSLVKLCFEKSKEQKELTTSSKIIEKLNTKSDSEDDDKDAKKAKRRKSRWGDTSSSSSAISNIGLPGFAAVTTLGGVINPLPIIPPTTSQPQLSRISRQDSALIQYAMKTYGNINLSEEDWKKCEDHYKISLLYQEMLFKRQEIERLAAAGRFKYEYDSDEEIDENGTWEHRLRQQEMEATQKWSCELTRQATGKHHIGDFLPPDELKRFMDKYSSAKSGKEPDLSDYKEYKLKEDNIGFKMLQKLGWSEGEGLGADGSGITNPINKSNQRDSSQGLGVQQTEGIDEEDDEFDAYRKRMMLAYRFRPNPLNNPRRPYY